MGLNGGAARTELDARFRLWWRRGGSNLVAMLVVTGVVVATTAWAVGEVQGFKARRAAEAARIGSLSGEALAGAIALRDFSLGSMLPFDGGVLASVSVDGMGPALCRVDVDRGDLLACSWVGRQVMSR